ncbi:MAG: hypothetical protein QXO40_00180 [Candidatus Aenigmatarchaeota archaeon]
MFRCEVEEYIKKNIIGAKIKWHWAECESDKEGRNYEWYDIEHPTLNLKLCIIFFNNPNKIYGFFVEDVDNKIIILKKGLLGKYKYETL